jgi:FG-GAP-like repeat
MKGSRGSIPSALVVLTAMPLTAAQSPPEWSAGPFGFNEVLRFGTRELDPSDSAFVDLDADGDRDLLVVRHSVVGGERGDVITFRNEGYGSFAPFSDSPLLVADDVAGCDVADMEGDGDEDILFWGERDSLQVARSLGRGEFATATVAPQSDGQPLSTGGVALWIDVDSDGQQDVLALCKPWSWRLCTGDATFDRPLLVPARPEAKPWTDGDVTDAAAGDLELDGDIDVLVTRWLATPNEVLRNDDGRLVRAHEAFLPALPGLTETMGCLIGDLDADTRPDIAFARYGTYEQPAEDLILRFQAGGPWEQVVEAIDEPDGGVRSRSVEAADFDLDGDLDLFVLGAVNAASYFGEQTRGLHFSGRTFWAERRISYIDGNTCAVADADADGDADLYVDCQLLQNAAR